MSFATISPDVAENRQVSTVTQSASRKEELAALLASASESQTDCQASILDAHLTTGTECGAYILSAVAGITIDPNKAVLAAIDAIIDDSHDGRSRNVRRQEIKRQVCLSHLGGIVNLSGLPVGHAFQLVGAKIVSFDLASGKVNLDLDALTAARQVIADYRRAPMDAKTFRAALMAALGRKSNRMSHQSLLESLRGVLADSATSEERRKLIYATHPELDPSWVDPAEVTNALCAIGKLTKASQLAALVKLLASDPTMQEALLAELLADGE